jgi:hypothetical protein
MDEYDAFRKRAAAAGYSPEEIEADIAKQKAVTANPLKKEGAMNLARSAAKGATFGFNDELGGVIASLVPGGKDYAGMRDEIREKDKAFSGAHPFIAGGAEMAGGLLVPGLGAVKTVGTGA